LTRVAAIFAAIDRPYVRRIDAGADRDAVRASALDALHPLLR
jgi:hypothetical protein